MHNFFVVIVANSPAQLVIVHAGLALANTPQQGDRLGVQQLELPVAAHPRNDVGVLVILEQFQQELPELYLT